MLVQIVTENGQKKVIPLTADAGAGAPVGTIIAMYKKSSPSGYLYCDGSTFDETQYPLLYAYLGSNVLPDYREFALVGAEENTTDVYNASTNPNGTIHDHDVYTEGQAKDDQLQDHKHDVVYFDGVNNYGFTAIAINQGSGNAVAQFTNVNSNIRTRNIISGRASTVTRGKRKAVYFYIKATSGLSENAQDNVVAQLNEERSYSTEEVNTGKKWIDGKPIYRKTKKIIISSTSQDVDHNIANIDFVTDIRAIMKGGTQNDTFYPSGFNSSSATFFFAVFATYTQYSIRTVSDYVGKDAYITIEYTKTTD